MKKMKLNKRGDRRGFYKRTKKNRLRMSNSCKRNWTKERRDRFKKYLRTKEGRESRSRATKAWWNSKNRVERIIHLKNSRDSKKRKDGVRRHWKRYFSNPRNREKHSKCVKRFMKSYWTKSKRREAAKRTKEQHKNFEYREKMARVLSQKILTSKPTKPELDLFKFLKSYGIEFKKQKRIILKTSFTVVDAYIPSLKLLIYTDSWYWHKELKDREERDLKIRKEARSLGYKVFVVKQWRNKTCEFERLLRRIIRVA